MCVRLMMYTWNHTFKQLKLNRNMINTEEGNGKYAYHCVSIILKLTCRYRNNYHTMYRKNQGNHLDKR